MAFTLPASLDQVPREARVPETFGSFAGAIGIGATCVTIGELVGVVRGDTSTDELRTLGIALGIAALCFAWEIGVRVRRTTLVFAGSQIGLYRRGKLDQVIAPSQMSWYRLRLLNSLREVIAFGLCTLFGGCGALVVPWSEGGWTMLAILGALSAGALGLGGSIWSRWMCRHYIVPRGRGSETVVLPKSALARAGVVADGQRITAMGFFHR